MGWAAIVLLIAIMLVCSWIIFHHKQFSENVITLATFAMLIDILGAILSIWRVVIGKRDPEALTPVTEAAIQQVSQT